MSIVNSSHDCNDFTSRARGVSHSNVSSYYFLLLFLCKSTLCFSFFVCLHHVFGVEYTPPA